MGRSLRLGLAGVVVVLLVACSARVPASTSHPSTAASPTGAARSSATSGIVPSTLPLPSVSPWEEGWRHSVTCDEPPKEVPRARCQATLINATGMDQPGWPVELWGPCHPSLTSETGVLFTACVDDADGNNTLVHAFGVEAGELNGWPIRLEGSLADLSWNDLEYGCGTVVASMAVGSEVVYVAMAGDGPPELHAVGLDGVTVAGFPRPLPGDGTTACDGFVVAPDGSLRAWGYEGALNEDGGLGYIPFARRTVFEAIAPDGSTMPGWPIGATGTSSGPIVSADGTLLHVTEAGNVWAHDAAGNSGPEWPYVLPGPARPYPTPDGRLLFLLSGEAGDRVIALRTSGGMAPGWPIDLPGRRESQCFGPVADCYGPVQPAIGPDGTLYLALAADQPGNGGTILALDAGGTAIDGWPFRFEPRTRAIAVSIDPAGNLTVAPVVCLDDGCLEEVEADGLTIRPSGQVAGG